MADRGTTIQDLQDDIDLYQTLLNSLEDAADDDEEKVIYMDKLRELKEQYHRLAYARHAEASPRVSSVDGSRDVTPSWSFADVPPAGASTVSLPTRKRDRSFLDVDDADSSRSNKSRRVSPSGSPAISAVDSIDSNYFNDPEWNDILQGEWSTDLVRQNRDYLKEREAQKRQQEEDERFARQLQEEWSQSQEPGPSTQPPRPQSQNQSQSLFRPNGSFVMPPPSQRSEPPAPARRAGVPLNAGTVLIDSDDEDDDLAFVSRDDWNTRFPSSSSSRTMPGSFGTDWSPAPAGGSVYGHQPSYGYTPQMTSMERIRAMGGSVLDTVRGVVGLDPEMLMTMPLSRNYYPEVDPRETQEEIKQLLQHIRPDDDLNATEVLPQTEGLKVQMMPHQLKGVAWMKKMEEGSNKGGILADDMGLGKTLQTIALMLERPPDPEKHRPTLIVAPVALLEQWKREFLKLVQRSFQPTTVTIHGPTGSRKAWQDIARFDVVLTTYGTLASELKREINWEERLKRNPAAKRTKKDECPLLSEKSRFYRIILDEAQAIKNKATKTAQAAYRLQAEYRWCLSGTPMQNRVEEIYSLIKFCRIAPFNNERKFNADIAAPLRQSREQGKVRGMEKLQALLKAILLRRTKKSEIDGKPILQLPEKHTVEERAIFDRDQLQFYQALEKDTQIQFNKYVTAGTVGRNYSKALVLLLRLRQCCCSPQLITNTADFVTDSGIEGIDMIANAKQLPADVVRRIKNQEENECPICMDAVENPTIFFPCGHALCTDCFSRMVDGVAMQAGDDIKCPHCRARIDQRKITDLKSFNDAFDETERVRPVSEDSEEEEDDSDSDDSDSESDISDSDDGGDLKDFIVPDDEVTESDDEELDLDENPRVKDKESATKKAKKGKKKRKGKKKKDKQKKDKQVNLAHLRKEGLKSKKAKQKYIKQLGKIYQPCAKIDRLLALLQEIRDRGENEKTIVFSSFTSFLDLIEVPLRADTSLKNYERYDGSMTAKDRNEAVLRFTDDPNCNIILVSLKAGNAGLNLTAANHVVILDPFWNPFVEYQAADRSHRIGQQREVSVHRILIGEEGVDHAAQPDRIFTVEDRILQLQNKKKELVESALDENASSSVGRLGTRELGYLFGLNSMPAQNGA